MPKESHNLMLSKPLPSSEDAERIVLGGILLDNNLLADVIDVLEPSDFYTPRNNYIYFAMLKLFRKNERIDPILIAEELKLMDELQAVGDVSAITNLSFGLPHFTDLTDYARIVQDKSTARKLIKQCSRITEQALGEGSKSEELLDSAEQSIYNLRTTEKAKAQTMEELIPERLIEIKEIADSDKNVVGAATGFSLLDIKLSGIQPKKNIVLAARPGMGKSALAINLADRLTTENPEMVVLYFSLEMTASEITDRLLCGKARIDTNRFALGRIQTGEREQLSKAIVELEKQKIVIIDAPSLSPLDVKAHIRKAIRKHKRVDLVVIDHIGLMGADKSVRYEGRRESISHNARSFKPIAKEFDCTTLVLSQLNRGCEARTPPRPMLSDLRETGDIEQEADTVLMIYREEYYTPTPDNKGKAEILVTKNRGGASGSIDMMFTPDYTRFSNLYGG